MSTNRPSPAELARARRLLAHEAATGRAEGATTAAGRVHEKLERQMAPLVGLVGVHLLFARSARLTRGEFAPLADVSALAPTTEVREVSTKLRAQLNGELPGVRAESAAALFATFLSLTTTFVGERLTLQILRNAWPAFKAPALEEDT